HGRAAAEEAAETARKTFEEGTLAANLPSIDIPAADLEAGIGVLALFVRAGLAESNGKVRQFLKDGAVRVNDAVIADDRQVIGTGGITGDNVIKLPLGKKKHILVRPA